MRLTRASELPVLGLDGVGFLMKDGPNEIVCNISNRVLAAFGETVGMSDPRLIFWAYRKEIEQAASDKYDRTTRQQYEILDVDQCDL